MKTVHVFGLIPVLMATAFQAVSQEEIKPKTAAEVYIEKYAPLAVAEMHRSRIPASITLAQGLLETAAGTSKLCTQAHNHFGIKCKKGWAGKSYTQDDDEKGECFRSYDSARQSFADHSDFLVGNARYATLFDLETQDYKGWARGLKEAGYATNPYYADKLIENIEKYQLQQFDKIPVAKGEQEQIEAGYEADERIELILNQTPAVLAKAGDTWQKLAIENEMRVWQLLRYNDAGETQTVEAGDTIFLKPKRSKAETDYHLMQQGESMIGISTLYAVKLSKLLERNRLQPGQEPLMGETVFLNDSRNSPPRLDGVHNKELNLQPESKQPLAVAATDSTATDSSGFSYVKAENSYSKPKETAAVLSFEIKAPEDTTAAKASLPVVADSQLMTHLAEARKLLHQLEQDSLKQTAARARADSNPPPGKHRVSKGDTYYGIARKYNLTVQQLQAWNRIDTLKPGMDVWVTGGPATVAATPAEPAVKHKVSGGETLYSIARKYGVKAIEITQANHLNGKPLKVGQVLMIPERKEAETPEIEPTPPAKKVATPQKKPAIKPAPRKA